MFSPRREMQEMSNTNWEDQTHNGGEQTKKETEEEEEMTMISFFFHFRNPPPGIRTSGKKENV